LLFRGRVLFLLVNFLPSHATPEEKLEKVDQSIEKFRTALQLEKNKTDAQFNLAQALHQRSEILQETTEIDNAYGASAAALQEAIDTFENVYNLQEKEYLELTEPEDESPKEEEKAEEEEHNHDHDHDHEDAEEHKKDKEGSAKDQQEFTTVTKVEATTVYSLIETLLSTAETMTTMASMLASYPASMDLFSRARAKLGLAEKWLSKMPSQSNPDDEVDAEKEKKLARIQINLREASTYAAMADRSFLASGTVDNSLFGKATEKLDEITTQYDPRNVEAMCDRGDILTSYGQAIAEVASKKNLPLVPEKDGKEVWQLYASATKSFQAALALEPKNLSILNKLGDLSLIRANLDLPIAERNKLQLLKNAQFYFKHAVEVDKEVLISGYIGWAMSEWALEEWAEVAGKKEDALKIIRVWIKRGGNGSLFRSSAEDNESWDEDFVEFIIVNFFADDEESE
jgi:tetratricopeptide (TPR) repeat protein